MAYPFAGWALMRSYSSRGQRAGIVEDLFRYADLSHIVQYGRPMKIVLLLFVKVEALRHEQAVLVDPFRMARV